MRLERHLVQRPDSFADCRAGGSASTMTVIAIAARTSMSLNASVLLPSIIVALAIHERVVPEEQTVIVAPRSPEPSSKPRQYHLLRNHSPSATASGNCRMGFLPQRLRTTHPRWNRSEPMPHENRSSTCFRQLCRDYPRGPSACCVFRIRQYHA